MEDEDLNLGRFAVSLGHDFIVNTLCHRIGCHRIGLRV